VHAPLVKPVRDRDFDDCEQQQQQRRQFNAHHHDLDCGSDDLSGVHRGAALKHDFRGYTQANNHEFELGRAAHDDGPERWWWRLAWQYSAHT
jgi:hypothetical protein